MSDLRWLASLGLTVEQLASRTGRTPTAIRHELANTPEPEPLEPGADPDLEPPC